MHRDLRMLGFLQNVDNHIIRNSVVVNVATFATTRFWNPRGGVFSNHFHLKTASHESLLCLLLLCLFLTWTFVRWQCWRVERCRAWESHGDCGKPTPVQDSRLVLEQEEGSQGWEVFTGCFQCLGHEAQGWSGTPKEDQVCCMNPVLVSALLHFLTTFLWNVISSLKNVTAGWDKCEWEWGCRNHRGLRHYWGLRVRGQHTKTTGRRGRTVGVSKKR